MLGEGNGNPLQYSYLESPVNRGDWWAAVHWVTQSQTGLKQLSMHAHIGEGNGNPLQNSCLENPRDRGAWWAAVCWVSQSWTRLTRLSSNAGRGFATCDKLPAAGASGPFGSRESCLLPQPLMSLYSFSWPPVSVDWEQGTASQLSASERVALQGVLRQRWQGCCLLR